VNVDGRKLLAKATVNWPAKVCSIALALLIFVFHRLSNLENRFISVPLQVERSGNLIPSSSYTRMIQVTLRGDSSIFSILEEDIEAYIDFSQYTSQGFYRAPVQINKKGTALRVDPLEILVDPMEIALELDHKISKLIPLRPAIRDAPQEGYELISYSMTPTQVQIDGPSNVLQTISELSTDFIELDGRNADFTVVVNILNRDPLVVIRGNGTTEFRGIIREKIVSHTFERIPIVIIGLAPNLDATLDVRNGSVELEGAQLEIQNYTPPAGFLRVDLSQIQEPGTHTLPVITGAVPDFTLIKHSPETVQVRVNAVPLIGEGQEEVP
jgi:YbbR domain-containing protein